MQAMVYDYIYLYWMASETDSIYWKECEVYFDVEKCGSSRRTTVASPNER